MSTKIGSGPKGPPKHQNRRAWQANSGVKKKDKELGGKLHPYPSVTGVCPRCEAQIDWRRKYGKYKSLIEPAKCNQCGKRAVRQSYHSLCTGCAKERNICAKCCRPSEIIVGSDSEKEEEEQQKLEQALKTLRERDKRTLLRIMSRGVANVNIQGMKLSTKEVKLDSYEETEMYTELKEDNDMGTCDEGESNASHECKEDFASD